MGSTISNKFSQGLRERSHLIQLVLRIGAALKTQVGTNCQTTLIVMRQNKNRQVIIIGRFSTKNLKDSFKFSSRTKHQNCHGSKTADPALLWRRQTHAALWYLSTRGSFLSFTRMWWKSCATRPRPKIGLCLRSTTLLSKRSSTCIRSYIIQRPSKREEPWLWLNWLISSNLNPSLKSIRPVLIGLFKKTQDDLSVARLF